MPRHLRALRAPHRGREQGIVLVWMAIVLTVLVAFVGLACDWAHVLLAAHQLQNAADAAALAGARRVRFDQEEAREAAVDVAAANDAARERVRLSPNEENEAEGDVVIGRFDREAREFTPGTASPNAVRVFARRTAGSLNGPLPLLFGPVYGVEASELQRSSIAMAGGTLDAGIIALNRSRECSFEASGNVRLTVTGGAVQVNSDDEDAACAEGHPVLDFESLEVSGGFHGHGSSIVSGEVHEGASQVEDPLAFLPEPVSLTPVRASPDVRHGQTVTIDPGYYPAGISLGRGTLILNPGVYVLGGGGLDISGDASFAALGSLLYLQGPSGKVEITGSGVVAITAPDPDNPDPAFQYPEAATYEGVSIFQSRLSTRASRITGTSLMTLEGTIYFPSSLLRMKGTSDAFANQVIADQVSVSGSGSGSITVNYDGRFHATTNEVFLVK
ncbi:MAG: hypothetical protein HY721_14690 [Planctomycetes bacterium]|nr:hypothetical protein [Planctomycetota bacterium]